LNGSRKGFNEERVIRMTRQDVASEKQPRLSLERGNEIPSGESKEDAPDNGAPMMERVLEGITHFMQRNLKLRVNQDKSAVDRSWYRTFLGFTFSWRGGIRTKVGEKAEKSIKANCGAG
ncbi:MAG: hypothetical protein AB2797_02375, partial [Candidatus Thiodiazotropha sp.]